MNHSEYIQAILEAVDTAAIRRRRLKILFDPCNGSAVEVGAKLFSRLGELVMINGRPGQEPPRPSEPRVWTLKETAKQVVNHHCDIGMATDVDADRVVFIDELGTVLSEDLTAVVLVEGKSAVTPINSSNLFKLVGRGRGIRVIDCPVGPPEIMAAVKKYRADFAYEESGKYFFCRHWPWADGLLAGAKMLAVMAADKRRLSQIRKDYPAYFQVKKAVACAGAAIPEKFAGGVKFEFAGGSFLFIRASGTEPLIRIFSDSPSKRQAEKLAQQGEQLVREILTV